MKKYIVKTEEIRKITYSLSAKNEEHAKKLVLAGKCEVMDIADNKEEVILVQEIN